MKKKIKLSKIKSQKGVSLISLAITIVVLMALTAIVLKQIVKTNLLDNAKDAKENVESQVSNAETKIDKMELEYNQMQN